MPLRESVRGVGVEGEGDAMTLRSLLYRLGRLLGDFNAIEKGEVPQRVERRIVGKFTGRILGRLFR